jgi:hypothetical protein
MQRKKVKSTNLAAVGYNKKTQNLELEFLNGHIYLYHHVPEEEYKNLMTSNSKGGYFNAYIRSNAAYTGTKLTETKLRDDSDKYLVILNNVLVDGRNNMDAAREKAELVAQENPGKEVFVATVIAKAVVKDVVWQEI